MWTRCWLAVFTKIEWPHFHVLTTLASGEEREQVNRYRALWSEEEYGKTYGFRYRVCVAFDKKRHYVRATSFDEARRKAKEKYGVIRSIQRTD